jgi:hypothetical protein
VSIAILLAAVIFAFGSAFLIAAVVLRMILGAMTRDNVGSARPPDCLPLDAGSARSNP